MKGSKEKTDKLRFQEKVGILEWFHFQDYQHVERALDHLQHLGIKHLRTGFSWADYQRQEGKEWYDWLIPKLAEKLEVLPCFLYTPPSLGVQPKTSAPPRDPKAFADFLDVVIRRYDPYFEYVELWNEPNNRSEYDYTLDVHWNRFTDMIGKASYWSKQLGKKTVLGGMAPFDPNWLEMMARRGALSYIDVVGLHGFPFVFSDYWLGWEETLENTNAILGRYGVDCEVWITESGYSTWQHDYRRQVGAFIDLLKAPVDRFYWYSLTDLSREYSTVDGFHLDEREYYFGLVNQLDQPKLLYRTMEEKSTDILHTEPWLYKKAKTSHPKAGHSKKPYLITGGAGFVGTNLADCLLAEGEQVTIVDNISRKGVIRNARWLKKKYGDQVDIQVVDVRHPWMLSQIIRATEWEAVFHLAAQVAVTTSFVDPMEDFNINIYGVLQVLEELRRKKDPPPLIFTSTNKVYGALPTVVLEEGESRYFPKDPVIRQNGITEKQSLDFHSPYGCSKGAADQYVLDYARSFGIPAVVFRMSCIYGFHQYGNEDQGWVAHFAIQALKNKQITLYGDGKQVRDILFIDDLVDAFLRAVDHADKVAGRAFNIGGGPGNTVSLLELLDILEEHTGRRITVDFGDWREGDQKYYTSDTSAFQKATGWRPRVGYREGVPRLIEWLKGNVVPIKSKHFSFTKEKSA